MNANPLTLDELREMPGKPVYCPELDVYGIVKCETIGQWANIPFLMGTWHKDGVAVDFEYGIAAKKLKCYRIEQIGGVKSER